MCVPAEVLKVGKESALDESTSELTPPNIVPTSPGQRLDGKLEAVSGEEFLSSTNRYLQVPI